MFFHDYVHNINDLHELLRTRVTSYVKNRCPDTVSGVRDSLQKLQKAAEDLDQWLEKHQSE